MAVFKRGGREREVLELEVHIRLLRREIEQLEHTLKAPPGEDESPEAPQLRRRRLTVIGEQIADRQEELDRLERRYDDLTAERGLFGRRVRRPGAAEPVQARPIEEPAEAEPVAEAIALPAPGEPDLVEEPPPVEEAPLEEAEVIAMG